MTNHTPVPKYERVESPRERADRVRDFPTNTCGASRHLHNVASLIVDDDVDGDWCICTHEDPGHVAESMFSAIASLWEARTAIKQSKAEARREVLAEVDAILARAEQDELRAHPDHRTATLLNTIRWFRREIAELGREREEAKDEA